MSKTPHELIEMVLKHVEQRGLIQNASLLRQELAKIDAANRSRISELLEANNRYLQDARDAKHEAMALSAHSGMQAGLNLKIVNELTDVRSENDRLVTAAKQHLASLDAMAENTRYLTLTPISTALGIDMPLRANDPDMVEHMHLIMATIEKMQNALVNASDELGMKDVARLEDLTAICRAAGAPIPVGAGPAEVAQAVITRVEFMNKGGKELHEKHLKLVEADRDRVVTQDGQARGLLHGALCEFERFFQIPTDSSKGAYARLVAIYDRTKQDFAERHEEIMKAEGAADRAYEERGGFLAALQSMLGIKGRNPLNGALFGEQALEVQHELRFKLRGELDESDVSF